MIFSVKSIPYWRQWQAGVSLSLILMVSGFARGWTTPYIAQLTAPNCTHPLKLTPSEASWVASLLYLGRLFGSVFGAVIQEFIGRKMTLLYSGGPFTLAWISVIVATSIPWLYASRFFCGLSMGMILSALASFLGEIADPKIRGTLIVLNMNVAIIGTFLGNTMGTYLTMEMFSYVCLAVAGLFIMLFSFVPESAYHHIANGNIKQAKKSLQWYTSTNDVQKELQELQNFVGSTNVGLTRRLNELKKPQHRRNMFIICCLNLFVFCSGENTVSSYAEIILTKSNISLKPSTVVIALSLSNIGLGFIATVCIDKFGRRPLLIISGLGVCTAQFLIGFHFHMLSSNFDPTSISWLPVVALFLDYSSMAFGLGPVPHTLIGELFPPMLKTLASFCFSASGSLMSFAVAKSFQPYIDLIGEKFVFWTFAISALSSVVFTFFCISENKQMSLIDIQKREHTCEKQKSVFTLTNPSRTNNRENPI